MTENYEYLAELEFNNNTNLYNLFITTYNGNNVNLSFFVVERKHEMRLDLVSNEIYGTTRYVGTLCELNNILNPFSIRQGDLLAYPSSEEAEDLLNVPEIIKQSGTEQLISQVKSELINATKKKKPDPGRRKYLNNRPDEDTLPPQVLPETAPQGQQNNQKLKVAPDLFTNPKKQPTQEEVEEEPPEGPHTDLQEQETERVLVRRYIKRANNNGNTQ